MDKLKIGIVGMGWVSGEHMAAFQVNHHCQLEAVCSRTKESAEKKLKECGFSVRIYTDFEKMLKEVELDIISVCTPNNLHAEQVILAAEHGKHVLIEKPVALNRKDLKNMVVAVRKVGVKTLVSFVLHWNPLVVTIQNLISDDAIGEIYYGGVDYFHGIGPWYKQYYWNFKKEVGGSSLLSAGCHAKYAPFQSYGKGTRVMTDKYGF